MESVPIVSQVSQEEGSQLPDDIHEDAGASSRGHKRRIDSKYVYLLYHSSINPLPMIRSLHILSLFACSIMNPYQHSSFSGVDGGSSRENLGEAADRHQSHKRARKSDEGLSRRVFPLSLFLHHFPFLFFLINPSHHPHHFINEPAPLFSSL
jgi:hypothetical protein